MALPASPLVSVVVPVLDDARAVASLLARCPPHPRVEILVVDGGYDVRLDVLAGERVDVRLLRCPAGRSRQMNAGAGAAVGAWLLFVHADSTLPLGWQAEMEGLGPEVVGGWFRFALDDDAWQARWLERMVAWRVRWLQLPYGDQGIFVRRTTFEALGGYPDIPLMEDVALVRRLVRAGAVQQIPLPLMTSARRWRTDGWFRRSARNVCLVSLYFAGVSPDRLARFYERRNV